METLVIDCINLFLERIIRNKKIIRKIINGLMDWYVERITADGNISYRNGNIATTICKTSSVSVALSRRMSDYFEEI